MTLTKQQFNELAAIMADRGNYIGPTSTIGMEYITETLLPYVLSKVPNEWQSIYERQMEFYQECFIYKTIHPVDWLYKELTKFENSEYAGNSRSGQSAGTDLTEEIKKISICAPHPRVIAQKLNEVISRLNELSKPSETTKEQPLTNVEIDNIILLLTFAAKVDVKNWESTFEKLRRLKV